MAIHSMPRTLARRMMGPVGGLLRGWHSLGAMFRASWGAGVPQTTPALARVLPANRAMARHRVARQARGRPWFVIGVLIAAAAISPPALALDNGLAETPPMGFNGWNAFARDVDETVIRQIAARLVSTGLRDAGYVYVNLDGGWMTTSRNANGDLVPDPVKFPHGIKALVDYVHSKGLKFGIYANAGTVSCNGMYPGSYGREEQDARRFASWKVDYLKYDVCNIPRADFAGSTGLQIQQKLLVRMRDALQATGRAIVLSTCARPTAAPLGWAQPYANLWRTTNDIRDDYASMLDIYRRTVPLAAAAGPGGWNDPDMLEVGNGGMTTREYRSHFSLWAVMAAPLLAGTDLRHASATTLAIYGNKQVIRVNQDPLGKAGVRISSDGTHDVIVKELANGDRAVVLFNADDFDAHIQTSAQATGIEPASRYRLTNLWTGGITTTRGLICATVPAHGVFMYRVERL